MLAPGGCGRERTRGCQGERGGVERRGWGADDKLSPTPLPRAKFQPGSQGAARGGVGGRRLPAPPRFPVPGQESALADPWPVHSGTRPLEKRRGMDRPPAANPIYTER